MEKTQFVGIAEAAKLLEVTQWTLRQWDKKGILKSFQPVPGMHRKYRREDIDKLMQKRAGMSRPTK